MTLTDLTAFAGLVFGVIGAALGIASFLRDRASIDVSLQWDMVDSHTNKKVGVVRIQNIGRRPVYVSHVAIHLGGTQYRLLSDSIRGERLGEGDPPLIKMIPQEGLEEFARNWWLLRAQVSDSTGRVWTSPMAKETPSWARGTDLI